MKYFIGASALAVLALLFLLLYRSGTAQQEVVYDDDQEGLKSQLVIRFSHVVAENTPKGIAAQKFASIVEEKTSGRIKVQVYPNSVLYTDSEELKALKEGKVEMIAPSFSKLEGLEVLDLPFLFIDDQHIESVFTGPIGNQILERVQTSSIKPMALWRNGFKQMTHDSKMLVSPDDFSGERIRIQPSPIIEHQFKKLGASPVPLSFSDVYRSLESQEISGQENTVSNIHSKRYYTLQKYMTLSDHGILGYAVLLNEKLWDKLSDADQNVLLQAMEEATAYNMETSKQMNESQLKELQRSGEMKFHTLTPKEKEKWKTLLQPVYKEITEKKGQKLIKDIRKTAY